MSSEGCGNGSKVRDRKMRRKEEEAGEVEDEKQSLLVVFPRHLE